VRHSARPLIALSAITLLGFACTAGDPAPPDGTGSTGNGGGINVGSGGGLPIGVGGIPNDIIDLPPTASCADGIVDPDEACDDGNMTSGDGCGDNCRYVEPGYVCPDPGEACRAFAKCMDGAVVFPEQCDDHNAVAGDGCSPTCKFEIGYTCNGSPSACTPTVCGDGTKEGAETCDVAGNTEPFDGCSGTCQGEPTCTDAGCTSSCGDGLIIGDEVCDDGNGIKGDGCSETCQEEPGYVCSVPPPCEGEACTLNLPIVFRDFNESHVDFWPPFQAGDMDGHAPGIVTDRLDAGGKPVYLASPPLSHVTSAASFGEWYTTTPSVNSLIVGNITLYANGQGGFVNRFGPNGEQYAGAVTGSGRWCGNLNETYTDCAEASAAGQCNTPAFDPEVDECWEIGATLPADVPTSCCTNCLCAGNVNQNMYDGNPLFFPIDPPTPGILEDERGPAKIPAQIYEGLGWPWEPGQPLHNFHFTSEIAYWFQYTDGMTANFSFVGDDDMWVFLNRRLLVDLGGIHVPLSGTFSIAADGEVAWETMTPLDPGVEDSVDEVIDSGTTTVADLGLEDGGVYEIKAFHAERKPEGSSFQLTLSGFNAARSECLPVCGDGIIAAGEQCDDGEDQNTGGHNRCSANCTIGEYCGDGVVQPEVEDCDDADPARPTNCAGCRELIIK
jgi:fibro-slime domain-containing protein